jgi:hypothetical protein
MPHDITMFTLLTAGEVGDPVDDTYEAFINRSLTEHGEGQLRRLREKTRNPRFDIAIASPAFYDLRSAEIFAGFDTDEDPRIVPLTSLTFEDPRRSIDARRDFELTRNGSVASLAEYEIAAGIDAIFELRERAQLIIEYATSVIANAQSLLLVGQPLILLAVGHELVYHDAEGRNTFLTSMLESAQGFLVGLNDVGPAFMETLPKRGI